MKILIVEDERLLADSLKILLERNGFEAECVYDGEDGVLYVQTGIYDLVILDVMMPEINGYEVAKKVRALHCGTPILMLTAKAELEDEIEGLNAGADYYLTKPFDSRKLLACVHALLRRQGPCVNELVVGDTTLNLLNATVRCREQKVRLSSKEFEMLRYLMSSKGQILSKEQLLCRVWGYESSAVENHVEVYIGLLRKKLKYIGSGMRIETVRRFGYLVEVDET